MDPIENLMQVIRLIESEQFVEARDMLSHYIGWREAGGFEPQWQCHSQPMATISGDQLKSVLFLAITAGLRHRKQG